MHFKIDLASLIAGSKFTVFALFYFVFEGNFPNTTPPGGGGLYLEGRFNGGFLALRVWGAYGGAFFSEFYGILKRDNIESIWTSCFKIRAKIEVKGHLSGHITDEFA